MAVEYKENRLVTAARNDYQKSQDQLNRATDDEIWEAASKALERENERKKWNAEYQRDLRTIKRLGLDMTVAAYRKMKESEK